MRKPVVVVHIEKELRDDKAYKRGLATIAKALLEVMHEDEKNKGTAV